MAHYIYLVGGLRNGDPTDGVYRFDIDTQEFATVGELQKPTAWPLLHYHNDNIYMIGGTTATNGQHKQLLSYNVTKPATHVLVSDLLVSQLRGSANASGNTSTRTGCRTRQHCTWQQNQPCVTCYTGHYSIR
ncbi:hypothetical protein SAMD00019534_058240 [Acytostelium subglobosum LB1]|uniref:hypothetical protein n=1 Tax=Acytostelium subglobosum LB1 TaxID=1410327 RepID=UPI000644BFD9|nr:hypothetical protein SAMD00019534_058240 [Acytostelium subglobosum LB1]GAM22649.1 hypothetical protein SAMD00019534_058240 [Acytostelium subglobosum LB1]|eukprot:XP_012754769.1 hypothetical protein SAMD00019534_058240 [Acytostelium subglobosum LB1]